jgi:hypothetical protein
MSLVGKFLFMVSREANPVCGLETVKIITGDFCH